MINPITAIDFVQALQPNEIAFSDAIPIVGHTVLYGMIYAANDVTIIIEQGVNDRGVLQFRHSESFLANAGAAVTKEAKLFGKFVRLSFQNMVGVSTPIEAFFAIRDKA